MKFRFLFNPPSDDKHSEMLDHEAPTPESAQNRAQALIEMASGDYKSITIFAESGGRWRSMAICTKFL